MVVSSKRQTLQSVEVQESDLENMTGIYTGTEEGGLSQF